MSPANQLDLQKALRDNSEDTKNTFRDLKMWEQEIKKKEIKIKNSRDESEVRKKCLFILWINSLSSFIINYGSFQIMFNVIISIY